MASGGDSDGIGWPYVAFDIDPRVVKVSVSEHCAWIFQCQELFKFKILLRKSAD
jgi:hypothetical protein